MSGQPLHSAFDFFQPGTNKNIRSLRIRACEVVDDTANRKMLRLDSVLKELVENVSIDFVIAFDNYLIPFTADGCEDPARESHAACLDIT